MKTITVPLSLKGARRNLDLVRGMVARAEQDPSTPASQLEGLRREVEALEAFIERGVDRAPFTLGA